MLRASSLLQAPLPPVPRFLQQHETLLQEVVVLRSELLRDELLRRRSELLQLEATPRDTLLAKHVRLSNLLCSARQAAPRQMRVGRLLYFKDQAQFA